MLHYRRYFSKSLTQKHYYTHSSMIFPFFHPSSVSLPNVCGVNNNDVFSSFTESMTYAHDHYWIYGGVSRAWEC